MRKIRFPSSLANVDGMRSSKPFATSPGHERAASEPQCVNHQHGASSGREPSALRSHESFHLVHLHRRRAADSVPQVARHSLHSLHAIFVLATPLNSKGWWMIWSHLKIEQIDAIGLFRFEVAALVMIHDQPACFWKGLFVAARLLFWGQRCCTPKVARWQRSRATEFGQHSAFT